MTIARNALLAGALLLSGVAQAAEITVYKQPNFSGESLPLERASHDLARLGFHDQISSIVVHSGAWEACTQPNFRGDCVVLPPGSYPALDTRINHRIESLREAPAYVLKGRETRTASASERRGEPPAALELFASSGFMGRAQAVHRDTHALVETGFDAPASSLVVREGTWQLCTEPGYQGVCRVFSPGRYADLGRMNNQVVSVRRITPPR